MAAASPLQVMVMLAIDVLQRIVLNKMAHVGIVFPIWRIKLHLCYNPLECENADAEGPSLRSLSRSTCLSLLFVKITTSFLRKQLPTRLQGGNQPAQGGTKWSSTLITDGCCLIMSVNECLPSCSLINSPCVSTTKSHCTDYLYGKMRSYKRKHW